MSAQIIDGKAFAGTVREKVAAHVTKLKSEHNITPGLAVVLVGEDPASQVYVRSKGKQTVEVGMKSVEHKLDVETSEADLLALIDQLNNDDSIHGILVQLPLPKHLDEDLVINSISPAKDVDGFHISNVGLLGTGQKSMVPCTPLGCLMMLRDHHGSLSGMDAVVIGRSNIVGKPMAQLLLGDSCTVTIAHSRTKDLPDVVRRADIVVAAVGRPEMVPGDWIKEGATVISQYCDVIGVRTFPSLTDREKDYQELILNQFIKYASVPVISLESATRHPLQSLTDLITIQEHQKTTRPKVVLSWANHPKALPQAVANSFVEWMIAADMDLTITHPKDYELSTDFVKNTPIEYNQAEAFENADFIYAKNWSAFHDYGKIIEPKENWMITSEKMALTNNAHFMHCLPVRRNVVVTDSVIDSPKSLVIQQSNNRTYAAQAVLYNILKR